MANERPFPPQIAVPLRVRAYLQTGVVSDQYLPLDGVLYNQAVRQAQGPIVASLPGASAVPTGAAVRLPFVKKNRRGDDWYYACSFARWPDHVTEQKQYYAKRFDLQHSDLIDFSGRRAQVETARGTYKGLFVQVYYRHALYVDWYCVANRPELERLLRYATHLGKKSAQGWGRVLRWQVDDWAEDWSSKDSQGRVMRALPRQNGNSGVLYGIRPSYWLPKHQFPCVLPG